MLCHLSHLPRNGTGFPQKLLFHHFSLSYKVPSPFEGFAIRLSYYAPLLITIISWTHSVFLSPGEDADPNDAESPFLLHSSQHSLRSRCLCHTQPTSWLQMPLTQYSMSIPHVTSSLPCPFPRSSLPDMLGSGNLNSKMSVLGHGLLSLALFFSSPYYKCSPCSAELSHSPQIPLPPSYLWITLYPAQCPWDILSATVLLINPAISFFFSTLRVWKLLEEFTHSSGLKFLPTPGINIIWASNATPQCFYISLVRSSPHSIYSKPSPIFPGHCLNRLLTQIIGAGLFVHRIKIIPLLLVPL